LVVGTVSFFGIDADGPGFDDFLGQGARFHSAREEQEPVEPLLAERRYNRPCQALLGLAAQGGKRCTRAIRIDGLAVFARRAVLVLVGTTTTILVATLAMRAGILGPFIAFRTTRATALAIIVARTLVPALLAFTFCPRLAATTRLMAALFAALTTREPD